MALLLLCQKILELDANVSVCFITAGEANIDALREVYPNGMLYQETSYNRLFGKKTKG